MSKKEGISNGANKGFTIPEVLVVMAIIAILSFITIPYYGVAKQQLAVQRSASKLAQDIRLILEKAMSVQEESACASEPNYDYGYGIDFDLNNRREYKLFADCNGNASYDPGQDEFIEQSPIGFEDGIEIESISRNNLSIIFKPPDPTVSISNGDDTAIIVIRSIRYPSKRKTITINKIGLIDID